MEKIELSDLAVFKRALAANPGMSCEQSPANLYLWSVVYSTEWEAAAGDRVLLFNGKEKLWQFPLGPWWTDGELAAACPGRPIYDVPPEYRWNAARWSCEIDSDNFDYLYENAHLAESGGPKLRKKRNLAKQFIANNPSWRLVPIAPDNLDTAAALAARLNRELGSAEFLEEENRVMARAWENFFAPELELGGVILYAEDDRPAGFAVYSPLAADAADIHFEKADHKIKGAPQQLTRELARMLAPRFRWMNREQDMGEAGLRQAKQSLDPSHLFERCVLTPR